MSEVRLYVDEDASEHAVIDGLRARGFDLLTTVEADRLGASDVNQLDFAHEQGRTIYTFNVRDFARLHTEYLNDDRGHSGIVVIPDRRYSIGEKVRALGQFLSDQSAEAMINRIEFL